MKPPLNNLKVIELASVLAGPSVGQFFAELGAEVIKIENKKTKGDVTRKWLVEGEKPFNRISAYFSAVNWGKKSVAVDLTDIRGHRLVTQLAGQADMVIASFKAGDDRKLGVDYESLRKGNSDLIYGHITGYGNENPRTGYDAIIQAEAGFMHINGEPGGPPLKMPVALMDILAAHHLKEGLLLALLSRASSGKGEYVHVSLFDAALASLANQATNWLVAGNPPDKMGQEHPNIVPYGKSFETADGQQVMLAVGTDSQFQKLCVIIGQSEMASNEKYLNNEARVKNRKALYDILSEKISELQSQDFLHALNQRSIPYGVINKMDQVFNLKESQSMLRHTAINSQVKISGVRNIAFDLGSQGPIPHLSPPPAYGQHTDEVLGETLRLSNENIKDLRLSGAID